jgi:hypothetical protein
MSAKPTVGVPSLDRDAGCAAVTGSPRNRPAGGCWPVGSRRAIPLRAPVTVPASTMAPPACVTAAGGVDPFVSVALGTARRQLAAIRAIELELVRYGPYGLGDENLQLPACSPVVGDGSGSRCSCGVSFSAPAVSWGPPPIAEVYVGARRR